MEHICQKQAEIEQLKIDIAVAKSNIQEVKTEIKEIKDNISKFYWWLIGLFGTSVLSLLLLVFNLMKK